MEHTTDPQCEGCAKRVSTATPYLQTWFAEVKSQFPDMHCSWGYRDQATQDQYFAEGETKLQWPNSPHNKMPAMALDLFQIDENGKAIWNPIFFAKLDAANATTHPSIFWGGKWKTLGDGDHFQYQAQAPA